MRGVHERSKTHSGTRLEQSYSLPESREILSCHLIPDIVIMGSLDLLRVGVDRGTRCGREISKKLQPLYTG